MELKPPKNKSKLSTQFNDPIRDRRVQGGVVTLLLLMVPVWPMTGSLWGIPLWALFAVAVGALASAFIAWVTLAVWRDPEEDAPENDGHV